MWCLSLYQISQERFWSLSYRFWFMLGVWVKIVSDYILHIMGKKCADGVETPLRYKIQSILWFYYSRFIHWWNIILQQTHCCLQVLTSLKSSSELHFSCFQRFIMTFPLFPVHSISIRCMLSIQVYCIQVWTMAVSVPPSALVGHCTVSTGIRIMISVFSRESHSTVWRRLRITCNAKSWKVMQTNEWSMLCSVQNSQWETRDIIKLSRTAAPTNRHPKNFSFIFPLL